MKEFTQVILKDIEKRGGKFEPLIASVQDGIRKLGVEPDIEAVLTVLDGKVNPRNNLDNLGAQLIKFSEQYSKLPETAVATVSQNEIETSIYNICSSINPQLATKTYSKLWEPFAGGISVPYGPGTSTSIPGRSIVSRIFTTNYDLSLEIFLKAKRMSFDDGFRQDDSGEMSFASVWSDQQTQLVKLHGSINYYLMENGKVVKSNAPLSHADIYGEAVKEQMMIYPMGEKYATRLPFYEMLGRLRSALFAERICIVIGYSFRDAAINNAFIDALRVNPKLRLILVSPSADNIKKTLDASIQPRTAALNESFGADPLPQTIVEKISEWYPPEQ